APWRNSAPGSNARRTTAPPAAPYPSRRGEIAAVDAGSRRSPGCDPTEPALPPTPATHRGWPGRRRQRAAQFAACALSYESPIELAHGGRVALGIEFLAGVGLAAVGQAGP